MLTGSGVMGPANVGFILSAYSWIRKNLKQLPRIRNGFAGEQTVGCRRCLYYCNYLRYIKIIETIYNSVVASLLLKK